MTVRIASPVAARQMSTFGAVSVATTIIDLGLFNLLIRWDAVDLLTANTVSYGAGIVASYLLNGRFTFPTAGRTDQGRRVALFIGLNVGGLGLSNAAVALAAHVAGESALLLNAAKLAAGAGTWVVKFLTFRRWVYRA